MIGWIICNEKHHTGTSREPEHIIYFCSINKYTTVHHGKKHSDKICVCVFVCVLQTKLKHPDYQPMAKESLQLAVHFLLHTYLHTKKKLRYVRTHIQHLSQ